MRKYLDIPLTLIVLFTLTVAMLWPLDQPPPAPVGSDKIVHFIAFAALAFPLARTGRFGLLPVFIGASAFGGAIELMQPTFNRSATSRRGVSASGSSHVSPELSKITLNQALTRSAAGSALSPCLRAF